MVGVLAIYGYHNTGVFLMITLHMLGLAHTQTTNEYSHCAFTGKVKRFAPMMQSVGYKVIHYGIEGADSGAYEQVNILSIAQWDEIRHKLLYDKYGRDVAPADFIGDLADVGNQLYTTFNSILHEELKSRIKPQDIICLPFGHAHEQAIVSLSEAKIETGIGYPNAYQQFKVYESNAWYHYNLGKNGNHRGFDYNWVIPNYYKIDEWEYNPSPERKLVYFGRLGEIKGLNIVWEIAKHRPDLPVVICGQGDPTPYLTLPNIIYQPPLHGKARSDFLGSAMAVLMPTRYVEPFGGVTVESQMTGTPVLGSTYGSFTETIEHGMTGYRCPTLGDYLKAIENIEQGKLSREYISQYTKQRYNMYTLAHDYDKVFKQVGDLHEKGWYSLHSHWVQ